MPAIEKLAEFNIYENPQPAVRSRQATFPGLARVGPREIVALFTIGEAFESADARTYVSRSTDNGASWRFQGALYDQDALGLGCQISEHYKPTALTDGTLAALGYGFSRHDPDKAIGPDANDGRFPPGRNAVSFSTDQGRTWSVPQTLDLGSETVLETSGPAIQAASGTLLAAAPPFTVTPGGQEGWLIASDDGGRTWRKRSTFFRSGDGHVTTWETRLIEMQPGRLAAIFWAYHVVRNEHLPNHVAVSHDEGRTWTAVVDTGHYGQAANLHYLGGDMLLSIHAHRAGEVGLFVRVVDFAGDRWRPLAQSAVWGRAAAQNTQDNITEQFASLKFGQPSLLALGGDEYLAVHWCVEDCLYKIKAHRLRVTL